MGILPLRLPASAHPDALQVQPGDRIELGALAAVEAKLDAELLRAGE